jgi:hypothetical protein
MQPKEHAEYEKCPNRFSYLEGIGAGLYTMQTHNMQWASLQTLGQTLAKHILKHSNICYLNETVHFGLMLRGKKNGVDLIGWMDSDWAQDLDSRWSISGYVFDVAGGSVSWAS